jgi:hypothetical protein
MYSFFVIAYIARYCRCMRALFFSKLKLIKNYLRSFVGQMRLSGLTIISIERDRAIKLDASVVTRNFAESKARRKNFDK